jgi:hypothetical protein
MSQTVLERCIVSQQEMDTWPVERTRTGQKRWAEIAWGDIGPKEGPRRWFFNLNTWPGRVVFEVSQAGEVARCQAYWRRSKLSIRMKGLKLLSAATGEEIKDALLVHYDQERVVVDFRPTSGPGIYHLYYGACEGVLFEPSEAFKQAAAGGGVIEAKARRIEARCKLDAFDDMEIVALKSEVDGLLKRHPRAPYLVFPQDRDRPIKLQHEIPQVWAADGPAASLTLQADRNEYRVFQLGLWACRQEMPDAAVKASELRAAGGAVLPASAIQCLTLETRMRSRYIVRPSGHMKIPAGQVRALWCGIDIPQDAAAGTYEGVLTVESPGLPATQVPLKLVVSNTVVPQRGDHDLWRLARLRWIDSDVGITDEVYPPYKPLKVRGRAVSTWGQTFGLAPTGLPASLRCGRQAVLSGGIGLSASVRGRKVRWGGAKLRILEKTPGHVDWVGSAVDRAAGVQLTVRGHMEYDGSIIFDLQIVPLGKAVRLEDLTLEAPYGRANAWLATGIGYRGRREGDRCWRRNPDPKQRYEGWPMVWMGSVRAGLGWATWAEQPNAEKAEPARPAWDDDTRADAVTVSEEGKSVVLRAHFGRHQPTAREPWCFRFGLLPTPVKPPDIRHWDFRYMHKGEAFWPKGDTPHDFLADDAKALRQAIDHGVKRLNLHDWWGPIFNYSVQYDRPDNMAKLAQEAHRRGVFVKGYNSGREMSCLAPEFWAMVHQAAGNSFPDEVNPDPVIRFQDAWRQNHLPDGLPTGGWVRCHPEGTEHSSPVSNATRNGNFYLESMRYMTRFFGTDGAYWDGADGATLGFRDMAKRLWSMFRQTNPNACIDVHHGHPLVSSPLAPFMFCFPFIDSLWHGEGFNYDRYDPWGWLVEIAALPFGVPSEMLCGERFLGRGMLFGIWSRPGWGEGFDSAGRLWKFFDRFDIKKAAMIGWWEKYNGVTVDKPLTYVTVYKHPRNGVLLSVATWLEGPVEWMEMKLLMTLRLDREFLHLPKGKLAASDALTGEELDIDRPVEIASDKFGRLIWVRKAGLK